jgi:tRNA-2-methylthio-N6-dimethylallyladenosine synthase
MEELLKPGLSVKDHDETRQGEALMLDGKQGEPNGRKLYIESYGCAMNFSDSEIVASVMIDMGFETTANYKEADVIFINTCSIRENAEQRVRNRLREFGAIKKHKKDAIIGVLGCMAERLKAKFLTKFRFVDMKKLRGKNKPRRKIHPIYNRIIWGHYAQIVKELSFGFTDAIREEMRNLEN